jgi:hypothetical protein
MVLELKLLHMAGAAVVALVRRVGLVARALVVALAAMALQAA